MPAPPEEVPDGLTPEEYARLASIYTLMGRQNQAFHAQMKAAAAHNARLGQESQVEMEQFAAGQALAQSLMDMLAQGPPQDEEGQAESDNPLEQAAKQMRALGMPEEEIEDMMSTISGILSQSNDPPPQDIPEDLSAREYYELGLRYKDVGWTEQARDALQMALDVDRDGQYGQRALIYLRSKIPKHPVPMMAVQANITGFNQMAGGDLSAARKTFEQLIEMYPDFEWPFGNLGSLLLQQGDIDEALRILDQAVAINPNYLNAWLHMARALAVIGDFREAYRCLDKAADIDPEEPGVQPIRSLVDTLKSQS